MASAYLSSSFSFFLAIPFASPSFYAFLQRLEWVGGMRKRSPEEMKEKKVIKTCMPRRISFHHARDNRLGQLSRCVSIEMTTAMTMMMAMMMIMMMIMIVMMTAMIMMMTMMNDDEHILLVVNRAYFVIRLLDEKQFFLMFCYNVT